MYRAFYALPEMTDSRGEPTNAIVGFANMLTKLLQELAPDYLALAFDKSKQTFRAERYAEYKGTRDKCPEELVAQIPLLHDYVAAFGFSFLEKERYEADDIIGTLATKSASEDVEVIVVTGDRDALQLVRPNLKVLMTKKGITERKIYDEKIFEDEYGFAPIKLIDLKGLMGDSSDNIPGVPGVGPKTATKLLVEYGDFENVFKNIANIKGKKLHENLVTYQEQAEMSKELATIELNVPDIDLDLTHYTITPDATAMKEFCDHYELYGVWRSFLKLYPEAAEVGAGESAPTTATLDCTYSEWTGEELTVAIDVADTLYLAGLFNGSAPFEQLTGLAVGAGSDGALTSVGFVSAGSFTWLELMGAISSRRIVAFDLKRYYHAGLTLGAELDDVKLLGYLLDPEASRYELAALAAKFLPELTLPETADEVATAAGSVRLIARLAACLTASLSASGMEQLYRDIELPLIEVLAAMEQNGVHVNREQLEAKSAEVGERLHRLEEEIYFLAGTEFNVNSTKQLGEVLFERLELPVIKKTKTGYSTNAEVLEALRDKHPIIDEILAYRMWTKLKSTYLDGIATLISAESGRVHTSFNQTVTATGRLSSSDPNLQNIPVRTEEGRTIRALFEPGPGFDALLSADYSQIELRILAHLSGDERFIRAFVEGQDIHAATASEVFGIPLAEVDSVHRRRAKAVNFGIVYGISDFGLAKDLHVTKKEAASYIAGYFDRYAGVKKFLDDSVDGAHQTGCVRTMFGRTRELKAINSRNFMQRSLAERMAMNTPIQGTAADIIKLAMIAAYRELKKAGVKSRILLQVHDELVLEVVNEEIEQVSAILKETMENVVKLAVPLVIDIHSGKNWAEAK